MNAPLSFDYDRSSVSGVYAAARTLPPEAIDLWRNVIAQIVPSSLRSVSHVLDAGCGTGRFSVMLADIFQTNVFGIDPSGKMLAEARARVFDSRCTFAPGALEAIPADDMSIGLAFLSMVFHHVRDWTAVHRELHRVLRPEGVVLVRTSVREALPRYLWTRFFPAAAALDRRRMPSTDEVIAQFAVGGFPLIEHRIVSHRFADDAADYLTKIRLRGLSSLQMIPDAEFERGATALEAHLESTPTDASAFTETMDLFCFTRCGAKTESAES